MNFETLMKSFGESQDVELYIDGDFCSFSACDTEVFIEDLAGRDTLVLHADIGLPPKDAEKRLFELFLDANHLFQGTNGATIARNASTGTILLQCLVQYKLHDVDMFANDVHNFLDALNNWKKQLKLHATANEEPQQEDIGTVNPFDIMNNGFIQA